MLHRPRALVLADNLILPLSAVTMTQVTLGRKGSGKTNTAVVTTEEMLSAHQQVVILDPVGVWWGLRSDRTGDTPRWPIPVFGGDHQDLPLESTSGEVVAEAIVTHAFSCVLDLSLFTKGEMARFAGAFLETLYRRNRNAMHLVVDEADAFAPQKPWGDEARVLGAMQSIVRRGRARGIGVTMISQRPQVLNKDVLTQADVLCAMRLSHPRDIAAVKEWVDVHADPVEAKAMVDSLPSLPTGEAWFWAPQLELFKRVKIRERNTFDSSATPKPGETRIAPRQLAEIDVVALGKQIAATAEERKANDPAALKRRIAELEKQNSAEVHIERKIERIDREKLAEAQEVEIGNILKNDVIPRLLGVVDQALEFLTAVHKDLEAFSYKGLSDHVALIKLPQAITVDDYHVRQTFYNGTGESLPSPELPPAHPPKADNTRFEHSASGDRKNALTGRLLKIAQIAAAHPRQGIKRTLLASLLGTSDGGSIGARLSEVKTAGAIYIKDGVVFPTEEGLRQYGGGQFLIPTTTAEALEVWQHKLRPGTIHRRMIDYLIAAGGSEVSRAELAKAMGTSDGGTFGARLSELRSTGLIVDSSPGHVAADREKLFL